MTLDRAITTLRALRDGTDTDTQHSRGYRQGLEHALNIVTDALRRPRPPSLCDDTTIPLARLDDVQGNDDGPEEAA